MTRLETACLTVMAIAALIQPPVPYWVRVFDAATLIIIAVRNRP